MRDEREEATARLAADLQTAWLDPKLPTPIWESIARIAIDRAVVPAVRKAKERCDECSWAADVIDWPAVCEPTREHPEYPRELLEALSTDTLAGLMRATADAGFPEDRWFIDVLREEIKRRKPATEAS